MEKKECCIGIDVSKNTLDIAIFDGGMDWNKHIQVPNNPKGYASIVAWLGKNGISKKGIRLCLEYTGLYAHSFRLWIEEQQITYYMVNPMKMHRYEIPTNIKGLGRIKTDQMDAFRIAIYCYQNYRLLEPSKLPSESYFKIKRLLAERKQYVRRSTLYQQQLHDISAYDTESSRHRKEEMRVQMHYHIKQTDEEIDNVLKEDTALLNNYSLLTSIIGIGRVNALTTIVLTENFTAITDPRKYACYIAVAPFRRESGTSVRGKAKVSKMGFKQAKADLSIAVVTTIQHDPDIRAYWLRKKAEGKQTGIVMNAIKFKLILRMFAVIKRQAPFVKMDAYK